MNATDIIPAEIVSDTVATCRDQSLNTVDEYVIEFEGPKEPHNPLNWSALYKWSIVILISVMSLVV
jgi:hypothetical protein